MINITAQYFNDIRDAIELCTYLLLDEEWEKLASYYDLTNTTLTYNDIANRDFFMTDIKPFDTPLPANYWKYKHPFPPGYRYLFSEPLDSEITKIWLTNKFEIGDGLVKDGRFWFLMRYKLDGYQIVPPETFLKKQFINSYFL